MSSTNRGSVRLADDYYRTPDWATRLILPHLHWFAVKTVLDPAAGDGAIMNVVRSYALTTRHIPSDIVHGVQGIEIDDHRASRSLSRCEDALRADWERPDIVIANPPYSLALEFCEKALAEVRPGGDVAVLLRLAMICGQERREFWQNHKADMYPLAKRPSFTDYLRWNKAMGGSACKQHVPNTKDAVCRRPAGHDGDCLACGGDSAEYAWFIFGEARGGHFTRLDPAD